MARPYDCRRRRRYRRHRLEHLKIKIKLLEKKKQ